MMCKYDWGGYCPVKCTSLYECGECIYNTDKAMAESKEDDEEGADDE